MRPENLCLLLRRLWIVLIIALCLAINLCLGISQAALDRDKKQCELMFLHI